MLHDGKKCSGPSQTIVEVKLKRGNGATGATSLKAGCVFTTKKYGSTTAATEVDIVKTVHWRHFLRQMLCLPKNNEVFYFNRLIPRNAHVNSFLLRYLIIGVSAAAYPGITWQNGECVRIKPE